MKTLNPLLKNILLLFGVLLIVIIIVINKRTESDPKAILTSYEDLAKEGRDYYKQTKFSEAEKCFIKAIELNPNSDIYLDLFSTKMCQDDVLIAEQYLNKAIELNPNNADALMLKGKYVFGMSDGKDIEGTLKSFKKAMDLGKIEAGYYVGIINYLENYKQVILNNKYDQLYEMTYPKALDYAYSSKQAAIADFTKAVTNLEKVNGKTVDWKYMLPIELYNDNGKIIGKFRSIMAVEVKEEIYSQGTDIIILSINNGGKWYTITQDDGYSNLLKKDFKSDYVDKVF